MKVLEKNPMKLQMYKDAFVPFAKDHLQKLSSSLEQALTEPTFILSDAECKQLRSLGTFFQRFEIGGPLLETVEKYEKRLVDHSKNTKIMLVGDMKAITVKLTQSEPAKATKMIGDWQQKIKDLTRVSSTQEITDFKKTKEFKEAMKALLFQTLTCAIDDLKRDPPPLLNIMKTYSRALEFELAELGDTLKKELLDDPLFLGKRDAFNALIKEGVDDVRGKKESLEIPCSELRVAPVGDTMASIIREADATRRDNPTFQSYRLKIEKWVKKIPEIVQKSIARGDLSSVQIGTEPFSINEEILRSHLKVEPVSLIYDWVKIAIIAEEIEKQIRNTYRACGQHLPSDDRIQQQVADLLTQATIDKNPIGFPSTAVNAFVNAYQDGQTAPSLAISDTPLKEQPALRFRFEFSHDQNIPTCKVHVSWKHEVFSSQKAKSDAMIAQDPDEPAKKISTTIQVDSSLSRVLTEDVFKGFAKISKVQTPVADAPFAGG